MSFIPFSEVVHIYFFCRKTVFYVVAFCLVFFRGFCQQTDQEKESIARNFLKSALEKKDDTELAEAYYRVAKIESDKRNILVSNDLLLKSIEILERKRASYELGRNYLRMSINFHSQQNRPESIRYNQKALSIFEACDSDRGRMLSYGFFGAIYAQHWVGGKVYGDFDRELDKALYYYRITEGLAKKLNDRTAEEVIRTHIEQYEAINSGKSDLESIGKKGSMAEARTNKKVQTMYALDFAIGLIREGKPEDALKIITDCQATIKAEFGENVNLVCLLERAYVDYYNKTGDYKKAIEHLERYYKHYNQALIDDRDGAISNLNIRFETQKKEAELEKRKLELNLKDINLRRQESMVEMQKAEIRMKNDSIDISKKYAEEQQRALDLKDENLKIVHRTLWIGGIFLVCTAILAAVLFRLFQKNKAISRRNELLLQEQNHRVKNNLQVVSSLLNLQANMLEDSKARTAVDETQLRIESMVVLHRQLYDQQNVDKIDMEAFLLDLTAIILSSYDLERVDTDVRVAIKPMPVDKAILVGLLLNELITNACKYAFRNHHGPRLRVLMEEAAGKCNMTVSDNGSQEINMHDKPGGSFGSKLIRMMVLQLEGEYEYDYFEGLNFRLTFNL